MAQSKSSGSGKKTYEKVALPKRTFTVEFFVGVFCLVGVIAAGYLSVGLGGLELISSDEYIVHAEFDDISGLKYGASVEIAGVPVGEVKEISLENSSAIVTMQISKDVPIQDDDILMIRTKGIIGDRYVKISRGASDLHITPGDTITETESVVDFEDLIGKFVHNIGKDDPEEE